MLTNPEPIIKTLLHTDWYKIAMQAFIEERFPDPIVRFAFNNRKKDNKLAEVIPIEAVREELDHCRSLRFSANEIGFIADSFRVGYKKEDFSDYFEFLKNYQMPKINVDIRDGQFLIDSQDYWARSSYSETFIMSIINALYYRYKYPNQMEELKKEGRRRRKEKIELFNSIPGFEWVEFGTRRAFSPEWQEECYEDFVENCPSCLGTSNINLAMKHVQIPGGTQAHELYMVIAAIMGAIGGDESLRKSQRFVLRNWKLFYGKPLSIALGDTFGDDAFFADFAGFLSGFYKGIRHDSGDPFKFGKRVISFYQSQGIDPLKKVIFFSDGLNPPLAKKLFEAFSGRIGVKFGIGTNCSNDLGADPLSIIVKAVEVISSLMINEPVSTVKISNNLAKAQGPKSEVERYQRVWDNSTEFFEETIY